MNFSEMGICPRCGEHCDFENWEIVNELAKLRGKDLISITIRKAIQDNASHTQLFEYIQSQAQDNKIMMQSVIGAELLNKII
jgi:hypothetical protein